MPPDSAEVRTPPLTLGVLRSRRSAWCRTRAGRRVGKRHVPVPGNQGDKAGGRSSIPRVLGGSFRVRARGRVPLPASSHSATSISTELEVIDWPVHTGVGLASGGGVSGKWISTLILYWPAGNDDAHGLLRIVTPVAQAVDARGNQLQTAEELVYPVERGPAEGRQRFVSPASRARVMWSVATENPDG
jgi:hypothetical protein